MCSMTFCTVFPGFFHGSPGPPRLTYLAPLAGGRLPNLHHPHAHPTPAQPRVHLARMPLVICYVAIGNGPVEIVDLPIEKW